VYYRRKILLSLIEAFGGQLQSTDFQKLLFALSSKQKDKSYHFVPYKFGSFSFQSMADKSALIKYGFLEADEKWKTTTKAKGILKTLTPQDQLAIRQVKTEYHGLRGKDLVRRLYLQHPYYAINSEIATEVLSPKEMKLISAQRPAGQARQFFTIGYEGISLEEYLNKLIKSDVKVLCDVRRNALSQSLDSQRTN
jgi:uncharacterized protein (DUF488 family)